MKFQYRAYNRAGDEVHGSLEAGGRGDALARLLARGLKPIALTAEKDARQNKYERLFEHIGAPDLVFALRNLAAGLRVGISASDALGILSEDVANPALSRASEAVRARIATGSTLAKAIAEDPRIFPPMLAGLVEAGEASSKLEQVLDMYASYLERTHEFQEKVRSALIYPAVLFAAAIGVVTLVLVVLVPRLAAVFAQTGSELPLLTRITIRISDVLSQNYILDGVVLIIFIVMALWLARTRVGTRVRHYLALHVPGIRDIVRKSAIVRIARTLGLLLSAGVSILPALELAGKAADNEAYRALLDRVARHITAGSPINDAIRKERGTLLPAMFVGVVTAGEQSGSLAESLASVADFYDKDVDIRLKNLATIIEPALILFMGLVVGLVALSVLLPIYGLIHVVR